MKALPHPGPKSFARTGCKQSAVKWQQGYFYIFICFKYFSLHTPRLHGQMDVKISLSLRAWWSKLEQGKVNS